MSLLLDPSCDQRLTDIFIATWPTIAKPAQLLQALQTAAAAPAAHAAVLCRVCVLTTLWVGAVPTPPQPVLAWARALAVALSAATQPGTADAARALLAAVSRITRLPPSLPPPAHYLTSFDYVSASEVGHGGPSSFDRVDLESLARSLCASDHELLCRVQRWELVDGAWCAAETRRSARGVRAFVARANAIVRASATCLCRASTVFSSTCCVCCCVSVCMCLCADCVCHVHCAVRGPRQPRPRCESTDSTSSQRQAVKRLLSTARISHRVKYGGSITAAAHVGRS